MRKHFLYSIQSLRKGSSDRCADMETGAELIKKNTYDFQEKKLFKVFSKEDFFDALTNISQNIPQHNEELIFLSIDAHGCEEYLEITDLNNNRIEIPWKDIKPKIIELNKRSKMRLVLMASCCYGAAFQKALINRNEAPFYYFFGPTGNICGLDILETNNDIIDNLYYNSDENIDDLIDSLNEQKKNQDGWVAYESANACDIVMNIVENELEKILDPFSTIQQIYQKEIEPELDLIPKEIRETGIKQCFEDNFNRIYSKEKCKSIFDEIWARFMLGVPKFRGKPSSDFFEEIWGKSDIVKKLREIRKNSEIYMIALDAFVKTIPNISV